MNIVFLTVISPCRGEHRLLCRRFHFAEVEIVSAIVGRTSDGTVTMCLSSRNFRVRSMVARVAPTRLSGVGWSLVSVASTWAGDFFGREAGPPT